MLPTHTPNAMISTLLIDQEAQSVRELRKQLTRHFHQIDIIGTASTAKEAESQLLALSPQLVFMEIDLAAGLSKMAPNLNSLDFHTILLRSQEDVIEHPFSFRTGGFLAKPIQIPELVVSVQTARQWIELKEERREHRELLRDLHRQAPPNNLVGIPTMEGIEFLRLDEIVRCEGLRRLTRIVTLDKINVISSYNIGEFCRLLVSDDFFAPHKSHLINLRHLRKYCQEGTILMRDGSAVPVSRRRKSAFLERVRRFCGADR